VFLFNHELLLIGIENIWHGLTVIVTSLVGILVFTSATQGWFINRLRWYEIIVFLFISLSLLAPEAVLNKLYPKFEQQKLSVEKIVPLSLETNREVHIKVTRPSEYGDRYKLFVIDKKSFNQNFNIKDYGIDLIENNNNIIVSKVSWNGLAKKSGIKTGDIISNFKVENLDRPNKALVYPFALLFLFGFGYFNYKRKEN
jgi:hypothetical protein